MSLQRVTHDFGGNSWRLDHIGHAVHQLDHHVERFVSLFNATKLDYEQLEEQRVEVQFLQFGDTLLELIAPLEGNTSLETFLTKRGEGLHHLCFRVEDIRAELHRLSVLGAQLIDEHPRPGARHTEIAFLHPKSTSGVLLELCAPRTEATRQ